MSATRDHAPEIHCRRTIDGKDRCPWRGPREDFPAHAAETGHYGCIVCAYPLADDEVRCCHRCISRAALDLQDIEDAYATLPAVVERSGYRMGGGIPGGSALVMLADGSMASPQRPNQYTEPRTVAPTVHVEHCAMVGHYDHPDIPGGKIDHPAYVEERIPSDGREHVADHWDKDPDSVVAVLEAHERDWRHTFGHPPAEDLATVVGCVGYLRTWLYLAARTHDAFDDFAHEVHRLRSRLLHVAGLANDPEVAEPKCFDCGGRLERHYGDGKATVEARYERMRLATYIAQTHADETAARLASRSLAPIYAARREAERDLERGWTLEASDGGLEEDWACNRCGGVYDRASYHLALRAVLQLGEWRTASDAARALGAPTQRIRNWMDRHLVTVACRVYERTTVAWWPEIRELAERESQRKDQAS